MKWWDQMPWSSFSECWALSQLFHSPLSPHFAPNKTELATLKLYLFFFFSWHLFPRTPCKQVCQWWVQLRNSGRGYLLAVSQQAGGYFVLNLLCAKDQAKKNWAQVRYLEDFPEGYEGDSLACFSHCFFPPVLQLLSPSMPLLTKYWAGHHLFISESCAGDNLPKIVTQTHVAGSLCYAYSLSHIRLRFEPSYNPPCLVLRCNEAQVLDVSLQKIQWETQL